MVRTIRIPALLADAVAEEEREPLARRMAELLELDIERVRLWLFARCTQEALHDAAMRAPARVLAP
jgi:hypothetical protein